jgi:hypothetical protein
LSSLDEHVDCIEGGLGPSNNGSSLAILLDPWQSFSHDLGMHNRGVKALARESRNDRIGSWSRCVDQLVAHEFNTDFHVDYPSFAIICSIDLNYPSSESCAPSQIEFFSKAGKIFVYGLGSNITVLCDAFTFHRPHGELKFRRVNLSVEVGIYLFFAPTAPDGLPIIYDEQPCFRG